MPRFCTLIFIYILIQKEIKFNNHIHLCVIFSRETSTRTASGPMPLTHGNGIIYSISLPNRPQSRPGPGTMSAFMQPLHS